MKALMFVWAIAAAAAPARGVAEGGAPAPGSAPGQELRALEAEIARELGRGADGRGGTEAPPGPTAGAPAPGEGSPYARLLALPDLSAVGAVVAAWNDFDVAALSPRAGPSAPEGKLALQLEEVELGLRAVVDPYARADLFIAFGGGEASVEEAYLTTLALPGGLQLRAGQLFAPFGRINVQHPHAWDFADGPLARSRVLAEEALSGAGLDLSWLAPLPWFAELHVAAQGTAPAEADDARLTGVVRLLQYLPVGDETTLGVGLSGARREEGRGRFRDLAGADLLLRWRSPGTRRALTLQGELFARWFTAGGAEARGGYAQLFWRAGAHAGLGARYDQAPAAAGGGDERRLTAVGTWYLTEFQRLRVQLSRGERPGGAGGWEALLHLEFGIGAHGAHPF